MIDKETKIKLLKELEKAGNISIACLRVGVGRSTYYYWLRSDNKFKKKAASAFKNGRAAMIDYVENSVFNMAIKDKNLGAAKYILSHNDRRYKIDRSSEARIHHTKQPPPRDPKQPSFEDFVHRVENTATNLAKRMVEEYFKRHNLDINELYVDDDGEPYTGALGP